VGYEGDPEKKIECTGRYVDMTVYNKTIVLFWNIMSSVFVFVLHISSLYLVYINHTVIQQLKTHPLKEAIVCMVV
jgi:hypothetical protein